MTREELALLKRKIWPEDVVRPVRICAVLDCARDRAIHGLITRSYREKSCLFAGTLDPELERAAPYLLELHPRDSVTDEIFLRGWQNAWGILVRSESSFRTLRRHLRTLLRVRTEDGRFLLFRFYDPRVLSAYLPTCTRAELGLFFGENSSIELYFPDKRSVTSAFTMDSGELLRSTLLEARVPQSVENPVLAGQ